ncbi:MAG: energy transducer TonB [Rikenellaceae bacterium]
MEVKKTPKADLQNKKGIFSLIGLALSILLMIGLFSWSKAELVYEEMATEEVIVENDVVEITRQEPPKVTPPKVATPQITDMIDIIRDDVKLEESVDLFSQDFTEDTQIEIMDIAEEVEEVVDEDVPVFQAEKMPGFQGGTTDAFRKWVQSKVTYPSIAEENNISGRVTLMFVVERDGSVSNIKVISSPDKSLSEECIRVIQKAPKWTPGEQRGKPVRVNVTIPITFKL